MKLFHLTIASVLPFLVVIWLFHPLIHRKKRNLPPGPPRLPIIGNLHQAPPLDPWRVYQGWTKQYGPIFSLQYGLSTVIILGTHEAAHDLLDKRSNIYSSRPRVVMGGECVSKGYRTLLMPYGQRWRNHQRLQGAFLNVRISQSYRHLQELESLQLIHELLDPEADFSDRYHRYSSSLIFSLAYGRRMTLGDEPEVKGIDQVMENFLYAARVGTWLVDAVPALNYLPSFLAPWKRLAERLHEFESKLYMDNLKQGKASNCWNWSRHAQEMKEAQAMSQKELAYDVGILYEAGSDTTTMALEVFTLAMLLYPEVMRKGQAELDSVLGSTQLPTFEDKDSLPYIDAIIKETLRWRPVSAGGIPHAVVQDDKYMGYDIPAGATVIGNHWAIHLDENVYKDAYAFNPDRWIKDPTLPLAAFGFGRRICTGQHIAKNSLFINIARILWTFDVGYKDKVVEGQRQRREVDPFAFTQGFNSRPVKFEVRFIPREGRGSKVRAIWESTEKDLDSVLGKVRVESPKS
ncbi:uncharacterized protein Z519_03601 [Cladophialophora bantiana CBS 173.52]|uniref:Cytochrome P450 n=1 Tax=Cladophialophora bantiana (strain ATCC 10958 / CBS 173.52 / CDC B-1940 / NIH 8579) TaxID=1442370 RepID=A0A0D2GDX0_CLAB1|nr:uncharacterized protein Z519_03601 [Cladophialophora bantiana CBS 173.52]KIW96532.1 hypothetical protein Z519_03601 [Cladophialophora bantiana CBS 173.52]